MILQHNMTNELPSMGLPTNPNAALPRALQAQLSSLMAQFLQYATSANTTLKATQITGNLLPASATHAPPRPASFINSRSHYEPSHCCYAHSRLHCPHTAAAINHPIHRSTNDQQCTTTTYTCRWRDHCATSLPLHKTCTITDSPDGQQYFTTSASSDAPKDHTRLDASSNWLRMQQTHPCMVHSVLDTFLGQYKTLGVAPSTRRTYQAGV